MTRSISLPAILGLAVLPVILSGCGRLHGSSETSTALESRAHVIELPPGMTHLKRPLVIPKGAKDMIVRGNRAGSTLALDDDFQGSAAIVADGVTNLTLTSFLIEGDRTDLKSDWYLPLHEAAFADYYTANGIVIRNSTGVTVRGVGIAHIRAFPIIVNATSRAVIDSVTIEDSGTLNRDGKNNTTGGILIEEGSTGFEVRQSKISRVTGTAIWTHSYARSPRQSDGEIHDNLINSVARDAIQIGHATRVRVSRNKGSEIGFPIEQIDFAGYGTPVAIDTAGNVDHTMYESNEFTDVNGQCIDLDGFHDGDVTGNSCVNVPGTAAGWLGLHFGILFGNHDPGMTSTHITIARNTLQGFAYGGVFLIGEGNRVEENRFLDVNLAHCGSQPVTAKCNALTDQPDALRSGIYLSDDGGRAAVTKGNVIRNNTITGFGISKHCVAAKQGIDLAANTIEANSCAESAVR